VTNSNCHFVQRHAPNFALDNLSSLDLVNVMMLIFIMLFYALLTRRRHRGFKMHSRCLYCPKCPHN